MDSHNCTSLLEAAELCHTGISNAPQEWHGTRVCLISKWCCGKSSRGQFAQHGVSCHTLPSLYLHCCCAVVSTPCDLMSTDLYRFCEGAVLRCEVARKNMYLKEDSASKRGKYEHPPGAYPAYPPAAAPGVAPYYPAAAPGAAPAAAAANRQYVSGEIWCSYTATTPFTQWHHCMHVLPKKGHLFCMCSEQYQGQPSLQHSVCGQSGRHCERG